MIRIPVYPLVLAAYPALFLFDHNQSQLGSGELWTPLAISVVVAGLVWAALGALLRSGRRAAPLLAAALLAFWGFGPFSQALARVAGAEMASGEFQLFVFAIWIAASAILLYEVRRASRRDGGVLERGIPTFNLASLVLVALPAIGALMPENVSEGLPSEPSAQVSTPLASTPGAPDIYYIVLDGFGAAEPIERIYQVDLGDFMGGLETRGFHIPKNSRANYLRTVQSLASSLNMVHLGPVNVGQRSTWADIGPLVRTIRQNRVMQTLARNGYEIYSFESGYASSEMPDNQHVMAPEHGTSEYQNMLLGLTPIPFIFGLLPTADAYDRHRERILYTLGELSEIAARPGPKFVFAHILAPHPPFVLDANGQPMASAQPFAFADGNHFLAREPSDTYVPGYAGQLRFISRELLRVVDGILAGSDRSTVIVLQGDHGPGLGLHHDRLDATDLVERSFILNAYRVEDPALEARFYDGITPVNTFRILFSHYLAADLPLLPDRTYFNNQLSPLDFTDITTRLQGSLESGRDE